MPGWKAVEGRGSRAFTDQDAAFARLMAHGIDESILYNRVPLMLARELNPRQYTAAVTMQPKAADVFNA